MSGFRKFQCLDMVSKPPILHGLTHIFCLTKMPKDDATITRKKDDTTVKLFFSWNTNKILFQDTFGEHSFDTILRLSWLFRFDWIR